MVALAGAAPAAALCTGPQALVCAGVGAVIALGTGGYLLYDHIANADRTADEDLSTSTTTEDSCPTCPCERNLAISSSASPQAAQHILDAQASGYPSTLTLDRPGRNARRAASLRGIPTRPGMDRDEYPPAVFAEGGAGASVRHVPSSDNRSAGGQMSAQLAGVPDGCRITMMVGP